MVEIEVELPDGHSIRTSVHDAEFVTLSIGFCANQFPALGKHSIVESISPFFEFRDDFIDMLCSDLHERFP
jgi:hypothetical protein